MPQVKKSSMLQRYEGNFLIIALAVAGPDRLFFEDKNESWNLYICGTRYPT